MSRAGAVELRARERRPVRVGWCGTRWLGVFRNPLSHGILDKVLRQMPEVVRVAQRGRRCNRAHRDALVRR